MKQLPRRDMCALAGKRAFKLTEHQAARAWLELAWLVQEMDQMDMPKFKHLYAVIRKATIKAKRP
jgi:hypothetical protein